MPIEGLVDGEWEKMSGNLLFPWAIKPMPRNRISLLHLWGAQRFETDSFPCQNCAKANEIGETVDQITTSALLFFPSLMEFPRAFLVVSRVKERPRRNRGDESERRISKKLLLSKEKD